MIQVGVKLAKDGIKADISKTYKFRTKNNKFSCLQWSVLVQNGAVYCHLGAKVTDFAPKLAKVGAKLVPCWSKVDSGWPELVPNWPKLLQNCV